jgi:hypothetical protein
MSTTPLDKALALARRRLPVFFCGRSKRPTLEGAFHNASVNPDHLRFLYEKAPGDLIGVPCGHKFVVIDPDLQYRAARAWLKANKHRIPVTRTHRTKHGGLHFLFKPHADFRTNITVHPHVDTRGLGSYLIWWPAEGLPVYHPNILAEVPDWIIAAMPTPFVQTVTVSGPPSPLETYLARIASPEAAFAGILRKMAGARPGERQALAFWCANRTCELILAGQLHREDALAVLATVAMTTGLAPRQVNEVMRRVERTVLS